MSARQRTVHDAVHGRRSLGVIYRAISRNHQHQGAYAMPTPIEHKATPRNRIFDAVSTLRFAAALGLCVALVAAVYQPQRGAPDLAAPAPWDASHYLLNAFLVPALEQDTLPLRWIDPRPGLNCGPNTTVHVNNEPLRVGTMVPVMSFDLTW
jgi:hypothetical protein